MIWRRNRPWKIVVVSGTDPGFLHFASASALFFSKEKRHIRVAFNRGIIVEFAGKNRSKTEVGLELLKFSFDEVKPDTSSPILIPY